MENNHYEQTIETYRNNFDKYLQKTVSEPGGEPKAWMDNFLNQLTLGSNILEIGSASGRDARYFVKKGYKVVCTDIIPQALERLSKEGFSTFEFDFRDEPRQDWVNNFDGFFANGVLLHASLEVFKKMINNISVILKDQGFAALSLKAGEGEEITTEKMDDPRYFYYYNEELLEDIFKNSMFEIIDMRRGRDEKWLYLIIKNKKLKT